jgi:uncharacterized protein (DUF58 family)
MPPISPEILKQVRAIELRTRGIVSTLFAGEYRSVFRGQGMEFAEVRAYQHGDDFRHIDWKAYRRLNRLLLRLFDEEQDLPIYLILDVSASMAEPAKFDMARRLAAALCYIGLAHLDRLTLLTFSGGLVHESNPGRGKGRIFRVFDLLERMAAGGPTDLRASCKEFASRPRQIGLTVIISDFLDDAVGADIGLKILRTLGHDVFAVHVTSRADRDPGALGDVRFVDAETGELRELEVTPRLASAYGQAWEKHTTELERFCGRYGIGYVRADAERPFEEIVLKAFRQGRFLA